MYGFDRGDPGVQPPVAHSCCCDSCLLGAGFSREMWERERAGGLDVP